MKKYMITVMIVAAILLPTGLAFSTEVYRSPTEMLLWDPDKAQNGYNAFIKNGVGYLLDMEGRVVNTWLPAENNLGSYIFAMENGNWRTTSSTSGYGPIGRSGAPSGGRIEEYTWDGERVWFWDTFSGMVDDGAGGYEFDESLQTYSQHHDIQRIYNSELDAWTYMFIAYSNKGATDSLNMGGDPAYDGRSTRGDGTTWQVDSLIEVLPDYDEENWSPANNNSGQIVWYWSFADHMVTTDPANRIRGGALDRSLAGQEDVTFVDRSNRISRPPLVVSTTDGDTDSIRANPQLLHVNHQRMNVVPSGPQTNMHHCNSFDYDENTGYIAINAKATSEFYVIDHDGTFVAEATPGTAANNWSTNDVGALARTSAGDFLYRFGNPSVYYSGELAGFGSENDSEMYGSHDIQWIEPYHWRPPMAAGDTWSAPPENMMLPGAGNFLIFDNGNYNTTMVGSRILEINPYIMDGDGTPQTATYPDGNIMYVDPGPDAINGPGLSRRDQVVWEYGGGRFGVYDFYSSFISGCTRMPNGNTIINSGANSHFFEVTPDKEVVWEYVVPPIDADTGVAQTYAEGPREDWTFRFYRFLSSHPALAGKDLTPGDTLTGRLPAEVGTGGNLYPDPPPPPTGWGTSGMTVGEGGGGAAAGGSTGSDTGY